MLRTSVTHSTAPGLFCSFLKLCVAKNSDVLLICRTARQELNILIM